MKEWTAYIHMNGEEESIFKRYSFEVPDGLYKKIQKAIEEGKELASCDFFDELYSLADRSFIPPINEEYEDEKPDRDDYDDEEEYQEDLAAWEEDYDDMQPDFYLESLVIYDPGDLERFKEAYVGKTTNLEEGEQTIEFEMLDEIEARYTVELVVDGNGVITDILNVSGEAMESESVRSSSWGICYPDYDFISEEMNEDYME